MGDFQPRSKSKTTIFGSMHLDSVPKVQSKQIFRTSMPHEQSYGTSSIKLQYLEDVKGTGKRSSFLPSSWDNELAPTPKSFSSFAYEGAAICRTDGRDKEKHLVTRFCTGSGYIGEHNRLGMAGKGVYKYPHGVLYDGYFNRKGEFHGTGTLVYPGGQKIEGIWRNGKLLKGATFVSSDNNILSNQYCKMPDRRFQIEVHSEVKPAGQEYLTNDFQPRQIPPGMFDTGNGFYDPVRRLIFDYNDPEKSKTIYEALDEEKAYIYDMLLKNTPSDDTTLDVLHRWTIPRLSIIESVPAEEHEMWIVMNCRKAWDEPTEYRADLYETWSAGYGNEDIKDFGRSSAVSTADKDDVIFRLSRLGNTRSKGGHRNRYSQMYSFILNHAANVQKYLQEASKRVSCMETDHSMGSPTNLLLKKTVHHIQRRSKKPKSVASSGPGSPRSKSGMYGYGLRYLMRHRHSAVKKKTGLHIRSGEGSMDDNMVFLENVESS